MFQPDAEQLQSVILSQDLIEQIAELRQFVNDPDLGIEIDPLKIYCQKTGHIVGQRDENSLFSLAKICGKEAISGNIYHAVSLSVHPAWIYTDGETLDTLIDSDPVGYACYCFGLITAQFYQNSKNIDPKRRESIERYWAMARANALLTQRGLGELTELNIELCKFLTYSSDVEHKHNPKSYFLLEVKEFAKTPDMLAMLAVTGDLTPKLRECTNKALARIDNYAMAKRLVDKRVQQTRFVDFPATPADNARGPSNIRQQRASRREIAEAGMFAEFAKLFDDVGLNIKQQFSNGAATSAWRERIKNDQAAKEAEAMADLIAIGGTNLDLGLENENDNDDYKVEVRRIAAQISPEAKTRIENAKKPSLLELIRAKKVQL